MQTIQEKKKQFARNMVFLQRLFIGLTTLPFVGALVLFLGFIGASGSSFSYKLVGLFLVFAVASNIFSKLTVRALQHV